MTRYNTNNPVPSNEVKDFSDNAQIVDEIVHSQQATTKDRFGNDLKTWYGIQQDANEAIAAYGYITMDSFQLGATLSLSNQVLRDTSTGEYYRWDGSLPKTVPPGSTPSSTGGVGPGAWLSVGDATVRQSLNDFESDLANTTDPTKGDHLVGVKSTLSNSLPTTQHDVNKRLVSVMDWCFGDGTDDGPRLQNASDAVANTVGFRGATLYVPYGVELYIASNVTLAGGVSLMGQSIGAPAGAQSLGWSSIQSQCRLKLSPSITITLNGGNTISKLSIYRDGMIGPENNSAKFSGTAFTVNGDDITITECSVLGMNRFVYSDGFGRQNILNNKIDCNRPVYIKNYFDVPRILNNHMWPFATVNALNPVTTPDTNNVTYRPGAAIEIDTCSWPMISNNFCYGHKTGVDLKNVANAQLISNAFEGIVVSDVYLCNIGYSIHDDCTDTILIGNTAVHHQHGYYINLTNNTFRFTASGNYVRDAQSNGFAVLVGSGNISGQICTGSSVTSGSGIRTTNTAGKVVISGSQIHAWQYGIQTNGSQHTITSDNKFHTNGLDVIDTAPRYAVTAAARLPVTPSQNTYYVTGATSINSMSPSYHGHIITCTFSDATTLISGGSSNGGLRVAGGSVSVTAGTTLQFMCEGASDSFKWRQITSAFTSS